MLAACPFPVEHEPVKRSGSAACGRIWEVHVRGRMNKTASVGELIAAVFEEAAGYSADPREVSRLATHAVRHLMRHAQKIAAAPASALASA